MGDNRTEIDGYYERICAVLHIFLNDPCFYPHNLDFEGLNPTRDQTKFRIQKVEAAWEWRNRVLRCIRTQDEIYRWEIWRSYRYMTTQEKFAFYKCFFDGIWNEQASKAIKKIFRNMEREKVFWE